MEMFSNKPIIPFITVLSLSIVGVHLGAKLLDGRYKLNFLGNQTSPSFPQTTLANGKLLKSLRNPIKPDVYTVFHNRLEEQVLCLRRKENVQQVLSRVGLAEADVAKATRLINAVHLLKQLKAGQILNINIQYKDGKVLLKKLSFSPNYEYKIVLESKVDHEFTIHKNMVPLVKQLRFGEGHLNGAFQTVALKDGIPGPITNQSTSLMVSQALSGKNGKNNRYQIVYEVFLNPEGKVVKEGQLLYGSYVINNQLHEAYYLKGENGAGGFYNANGVAVARSRLHSPLSIPLRITSPFGMRQSISRGYSAYHQAIDYGAPIGTSILAASAGRIVKACYNGGYGNYILINHGNGFATAYGHLHRYAVKAGDVVKAGQKIGEVGSTGYSTGPHLHFEVLINGVRVDPNKQKLLPVNNLSSQGKTQLVKIKQEIAAVLSKGNTQRLEKAQFVFAGMNKLNKGFKESVVG